MSNFRYLIIVLVVFAGIGVNGARHAYAQQPGWSVNPNEFAGSMTVTSVLMYSGSEDAGSGDRVGAFVNGQVRGVAGPIQVGSRWFFFLTVFGQANGERVSFKYYREIGATVHSVFETTTFSTDRILGTTATPFLLTADVSTSVEVETEWSDALGVNYPEPFADRTHIPYRVAKHGEVRLDVFNLLGQRVTTVVDAVQQAGSYEADFDAGRLSNGLYFYRLHAPSGTITRTMTLAR